MRKCVFGVYVVVIVVVVLALAEAGHSTKSHDGWIEAGFSFSAREAIGM